MAKKQESYELMTVFSLKDGEEAAKELVEKFREKIASDATLDEVNEWASASWLIRSTTNRTDTTQYSLSLRLRTFRQRSSVF